MKSPSLKSRILSYIQRITEHDPDVWVHKGDIERQAILAGYLADNSGRRLRELYVEGYLDKRERDGSVEYRYSTNYSHLKNVGLI